MADPFVGEVRLFAGNFAPNGWALCQGQLVSISENVVLFQLIPKIALAPLFIVWLGIGFQSRLTFSVFISFFPVVIAALARKGFTAVHPSLMTNTPSNDATAARTAHAQTHAAPATILTSGRITQSP